MNPWDWWVLIIIIVWVLGAVGYASLLSRRSKLRSHESVFLNSWAAAWGVLSVLAFVGGLVVSLAAPARGLIEMFSKWLVI